VAPWCGRKLERVRVAGVDVSLPNYYEGRCQPCWGVQDAAEDCPVISEALMGWVLGEVPLHLEAISKKG